MAWRASVTHHFRVRRRRSPLTQVWRRGAVRVEAIGGNGGREAPPHPRVAVRRAGGQGGRIGWWKVRVFLVAQRVVLVERRVTVLRVFLVVTEFFLVMQVFCGRGQLLVVMVRVVMIIQGVFMMEHGFMLMVMDHHTTHHAVDPGPSNPHHLLVMSGVLLWGNHLTSYHRGGGGKALRRRG